MAKRVKGKRTKSGQLSRSKAAMLERNPPADHILARRERFRHFRGDGATGFEMTCAGRLMLVGCFDGLEVPAESILNALQQYTHGYWGNYSETGVKMGALERSDKSSDNRPDDPAGEWFNATDKVLRDAGHSCRMAVHQVTVDRHWFPDEDADWAARIINSRIVQKREQMTKAKRPVPVGLTVCGERACDSDWAMLELLRAGAMALVSRGRKVAA